MKTPHGASLLQTDIHKVINGLYTPFGSPVIGGQKPYNQLECEASYFFNITKISKTMKQITEIKEGKNFKAVSVGKVSEIIEHELPMGPDFTLKGKVFVGQAVGATGSELSFQTLVPGQDSGFLHTHKTHEELYIILKGEGQYQVDGEVFPVSEGTVIRVSPDGRRALKNTGSDNLTMLCIQYKANAFTEADSPMTDGVILQDALKW